MIDNFYLRTDGKVGIGLGCHDDCSLISGATTSTNKKETSDDLVDAMLYGLYFANKPKPKSTLLTIDEVFVNEPKKIIAVKWSDGDITKVECQKGDKFDVHYGIAIAVSKKALGGYTPLEEAFKNAKYTKKNGGKTNTCKKHTGKI